jgi:DNA polymerase III subunit delta'
MQYNLPMQAMQGSIFIYGGSRTGRQEKAEKILYSLKIDLESPDHALIAPLEGKKSIGIEQVREVISFLSKKPYESKHKTVLILNAEHMTAEAQNALLKTLEEPPAYATIILAAKTHDSLLPTVSSRCQKILAEDRRVGESEERIALLELLEMEPGERLSWALEQSKEEKEAIINMLEGWVREERKFLAANKKGAQNIKKILEVKKDLENTNINTRLALEYLTLNLQ